MTVKRRDVIGLAVALLIVIGVYSINSNLGKAKEGSASGDANVGAEATTSSSRHMSRDEFKKATEGRTKSQILQVLGRPSQTQDLGGMQMWYYNDLTVDPVTGRADSMAQIMFDGERVQQVSFI